MEDKTSDGIRAVERALDVLSAFNPGDGELLAADLARRVGLSRPTLYRLLHTLEGRGFVVSSGEPQRFRLGPAAARLAHVWSATLDLAAVARPFLLEAWNHSAETVALFVPQGDLRLCVAELQSPHPLSFRRGVGYTEKLVRGASGRAILAFTPLAEGQLAGYAAAAGVDLAWLEAELALTRARGYALGHSELIQGATAVAAPFYNHTGAVAGSIGVFGPESRLSHAHGEALGRYLFGVATRLSETLGCPKKP